MRKTSLAAPFLLGAVAAAADGSITADQDSTPKAIGSAGSVYKYGWFMEIQNRQAMALWENSCWRFKEAQNALEAKRHARQLVLSWDGEILETPKDGPDEPYYKVFSHEVTAAGDSPKDKEIHCTCILRHKHGKQIDVTKKVAGLLGWPPKEELKAAGTLKDWKWKMPPNLKRPAGLKIKKQE